MLRMSTFKFTKHIGITNAFYDSLFKIPNPSINAPSSSSSHGGILTIEYNNVVNSSDAAALSNMVTSYTDPSYWLDFTHSENYPLVSAPISGSNINMQASIISPYNDGSTVIGSMKAIISYTCPNPVAFSNVTLSNCPANFTLRIKNYSDSNAIVAEASTCITDEIQSEWIPLATAGATKLPEIYKTTQIYGLKDMNPGCDCIWVFEGSMNNSNVYVSMNGLQKLYYNVSYPL